MFIATLSLTLTGILITNKKIVFVISLAIAIFAFMTDTVFYLHWNRALGISDKVFALGSTALEEVIHSFLWMPSCVIMAHLCPKGMEAIMFALLASCHNL